MDGNNRINQLAYMYSDITKKPIAESKKIILSTKTGKAISLNNKKSLYEQQTANLYEILQELSSNQQINLLNLKDNINSSLLSLYLHEKEETTKNLRQYTACRTTKSKTVKTLKTTQAKMLKEKHQNMMNVRRMQHVINLKG